LTPNTTNQFVVTASDPTGQNEGAPVLVPAITVGAAQPSVTVTAPAAASSVVGTNYTIQGTVTPQAGTAPNTSVLIRVWQGTSTGQKALSSSGNPIQVGYGELITLGTGPTAFAIPVPLTPNTVNQFVITTSDSLGQNESPPVLVPALNPTMTPATLVITAPQGATTTAASTYAVQGTVTPPPGTAAGTQALVRVWQGSSDGQKALNSAGNAVQVGNGIQLTLGAGPTSFTIPVPLTANAANQFVVTVSDPTGQNESPPALVPLITSNPTPQSLSITVPASQVSGITEPNYNIQGIVTPGSATAPGTRVLLRVWQGTSSGQKVLKDGGTPVLVGNPELLPLGSGPTSFTIPVPLTAGTTNQFVATVSDETGQNETTPVLVPPIVTAPTNGTTSASGTSTPSKTPSARVLSEVFDILAREQRLENFTDEGYPELRIVNRLLREDRYSPITSTVLRSQYDAWQHRQIAEVSREAREELREGDFEDAEQLYRFLEREIFPAIEPDMFTADRAYPRMEAINRLLAGRGGGRVRLTNAQVRPWWDRYVASQRERAEGKDEGEG
jgi:hypothetical protein